MKTFFYLTLYNILYPLFLFFALPGYLIKMYRRGGYGTGLLERFGFYKINKEDEPQYGIYIHAVSVGEVLIALKWAEAWLETHPMPVILAISTSTGHALARERSGDRIRVLYSPLDLPGLPERCLERFKPQAIILVEAELWPNMSLAARKHHIPQLMINARLSERSERRYHKVRSLAEVYFSFLSGIAVQDYEDARRFESLGITPDKIIVTGSIKFDTEGQAFPRKREEFSAILSLFAQEKPVILAASTHAGEEAVIAEAVDQAGGFPLIVPRHTERRNSICQDLKKKGWSPYLRSDIGGDVPSSLPGKVCYIADTTGELRDWTAHACIAIIGKSFLAHGGQNPAEAVMAQVPVVTGPNMENFQALVHMLEEGNGIVRCSLSELPETLEYLLNQPDIAKKQAANAYKVLENHKGATSRTVKWVADYL